MSNPVSFPQFITNSAIGEDKFPEKSQNKTAQAISILISTKKAKSKIIGLEGDWGAGKTNVIRMIENNLKQSHHVYVHDVWSFQEDLQRRTFLESLTTDLCKNGFLLHTEKWNKELKNLLAKRKEVTTDVTPSLSGGFIFIIILIALWTLLSGITLPVMNIHARWLVAAIALIGYAYHSYKQGKPLGAQDVFYIYKRHETQKVTNETIFESEPSPERFFKWITDLQIDFPENKELIVVFDNMDRLPKEKIRQMWALIHGFFSEKDFEKIWIIVPYSREHIKNGFDGSNTDDQTEHFIDKTFTIQYQVAPPILSDWKAFFNDAFIKAYGDTETTELTVTRSIFDRLCHKITPRKIINFINDTVALKMIWQDQIPLRYISLYSLAKREILQDPTQQILKKQFLKGSNSTFEGDALLQNYIAALVYNIPINSAAQVALRDELIQTLRKGVADKEKMNAFANQPFFLDLLETVVAEEGDTKGYAIALNSIEKSIYEGLNVNRILSIWKIIEVNSKYKLREKQEVTEEDKIILSRSAPERRQSFVDKIAADLDNMGETFSGKQYYLVMKEIEEYITSNTISEIHFTHKLNTPIKKPIVFMDYLAFAKEDYFKYGVKVDNEALNSYAIELYNASGDGSQYLPLIHLAHDKEYNLGYFINHVKQFVGENKLQIPHLKNSLSIINAFKDKESNPTKLISFDHLREYFDEITPQESVYPDLVAIRLGYQEEARAYDTDSDIYEIANSKDENLANAVALCSANYISMGDLLNQVAEWSIPLGNNIVKEIIAKSIPVQSLKIKEVIKKFDSICAELEMEPSTLLNYLNSWHTAAPNAITKTDIEELLSFDRLKTISENKNKLCEYLFNTYVEFFQNISETDCKDYLLNKSSTRRNILLWLLESNFIMSLPINVLAALSNIFEDTAMGNIQLDNANLLFWDKLCSVTPIEHLTASYKNVLGNYINRQLISKDEFVYFADKFKKADVIRSYEGAFCRVILSKVIDDQEVLNSIIFSNGDYYAEIVTKAGNDSFIIKEKIAKMAKDDSSNKFLTEFASKIGVDMSKASKKDEIIEVDNV